MNRWSFLEKLDIEMISIDLVDITWTPVESSFISLRLVQEPNIHLYCSWLSRNKQVRKGFKISCFFCYGSFINCWNPEFLKPSLRSNYLNIPTSGESRISLPLQSFFSQAMLVSWSEVSTSTYCLSIINALCRIEFCMSRAGRLWKGLFCTYIRVCAFWYMV